MSTKQRLPRIVHRALLYAELDNFKSWTVTIDTPQLTSISGLQVIGKLGIKHLVEWLPKYQFKMDLPDSDKPKYAGRYFTVKNYDGKNPILKIFY